MNETVKKCELKEISCTYKAPEKELPIIEGDSGKIRMALTRLLENAVEYTKNGGKISAELMIKDGAARFEVEDNGIGIPEEEQHRVFTRFFRASNAFTMQPDAFGLGLYVAKSFIEQHGGRMGFESKEGKGSKFWIDLPLKSTMS
jgi:signal transduction histidine kinase